VSSNSNDPPGGGPIRQDNRLPVPYADPTPAPRDPAVRAQQPAQQTYPIQAHPIQVAHPAPPAQPQQGHPPLAAYPPQAYAPQGYDPRTGQPLAHPQQPYPQQAYPQQPYPPQAYPPQGYPQQGYPGYPPQGDPQHAYPQQAYPGQHAMPVYGAHAPIHIVVQNNVGAVAGAGLVRVGNRSRLAAALFAFILGGFGAHKFYLGRSVAGLFYLLFCWTFIPSFIALIDFVVLLVMSDHDFDMKYNTALQR
jgi:TM2 domain-containing membrane protein YozV